MKLSNCKIGVVVETKYGDFKIGHIIGFSYNLNKEIIPVVQFPSLDNIENFKLKSIHYDNLKIYKKNNAK